MKISALLGASLTAAIVGGLLVGLFSVRDFGMVSIYFSAIAFAVAFVAAILLAYPVSRARKRLPKKAVLPLLVLVGGMSAAVILAYLTGGFGPGAAGSGALLFLYAAIGAMCALSALGYVERDGIVERLRKWFK
ncbi:hypothetical protein WS80_08310 [Burkholderia pseudomultivorans]|nr:hypothetical protein WS80_08310 [Burkholderia pseudomultivorans]